jgi:hypothetical protein
MVGFRFHDLRGVPIEVIKAQVGHVSAGMTRYYTHLGNNAKHLAVAAVQEKGAAAMAVLNSRIIFGHAGFRPLVNRVREEQSRPANTFGG